jgi:hypothetical protein
MDTSPLHGAALAAAILHRIAAPVVVAALPPLVSRSSGGAAALLRRAGAAAAATAHRHGATPAHVSVCLCPSAMTWAASGSARDIAVEAPPAWVLAANSVLDRYRRRAAPRGRRSLLGRDASAGPAVSPRATATDVPSGPADRSAGSVLPDLLVGTGAGVAAGSIGDANRKPLTAGALCLALDLLLRRTSPVAHAQLQRHSVPIAAFAQRWLAGLLVGAVPFGQAAAVRWVLLQLATDGWLGWLRASAAVFAAVADDLLTCRTRDDCMQYLMSLPRRALLSAARVASAAKAGRITRDMAAAVLLVATGAVRDGGELLVGDRYVSALIALSGASSPAAAAMPAVIALQAVHGLDSVLLGSLPLPDCLRLPVPLATVPAAVKVAMDRQLALAAARAAAGEASTASARIMAGHSGAAARSPQPRPDSRAIVRPDSRAIVLASEAARALRAVYDADNAAAIQANESPIVITGARELPVAWPAPAMGSPVMAAMDMFYPLSQHRATGAANAAGATAATGAESPRAMPPPTSVPASTVVSSSITGGALSLDTMGSMDTLDTIRRDDGRVRRAHRSPAVARRQRRRARPAAAGLRRGTVGRGWYPATPRHRLTVGRRGRGCIEAQWERGTASCGGAACGCTWATGVAAVRGQRGVGHGVAAAARGAEPGHVPAVHHSPTR